jgi:transcription antitermination factor NusG
VTELAELDKKYSSLFRWLVLYVRPRYEKKVHERCQQSGIVSYLPLREEFRKWSDRRKLVESPLFSGYLFLNVDEKKRVSALEFDGAMKYVQFGGRFAVVSDETIESIKIALLKPGMVELENDPFQPGASILVTHGPFTGLRGRLIERRGRVRVIVSIDAIEKGLSVEVSIADLRILDAQPK